MVTKTANMSSAKENETLDPLGDAYLARKPPAKADLERVANIPLLNAENKSITFGSLYPKDASHRVLLCFVRHFFCGYCQEYLKTLCASVTKDALESLDTPTSIVVIGCGSPDLIKFYVETTTCPFPVYAEPSKKIYEEWGMGRTLDLGNTRPEYQQKSMSSVILSSFSQAARSGRNALKGGDFSQVGGEFLLQGNEVIFCHRMQNTRDHVEVPELRKVLGLPDQPTPDRRKQFSGVATALRRSSSSSLSRTKEPRKLGEEVSEDKENINVST